MGVFHADAIVVRSREYGEADRLLTLFSREHGKIQAVAKGVRKPKSSQRAGAQLFTYGEYLLHKGKTLHTVSQASPKESFAHIWYDLEKTMAATAMVELLDLATVDHQLYPELFTLTYSALFLLEHCEPALLQCAFALKLLEAIGYRPRLKECAECGKKVNMERLFFSPEAGGVLCSECQTPSQRGQWLSGGSLALMHRLLEAELTKLDRIRWSEWMKKETLAALQIYAERTLAKRLKAWSMGSLLLDAGPEQPDLNQTSDTDRGQK